LPELKGGQMKNCKSAALCFFIFALPVLLSLRPQIVDNDLWWHLSVGKWISEHHAVPLSDPFSQTDKSWVAYSWLYELLIYHIYASCGLTGIIAYRVGMCLAMVWSVYRLLRDREQPLTFALTGLAAVAMAYCFIQRPWQLTVLFTALTVDVLLRLREGRFGKSIWLLPLVYILWANTHIQFVYGLFVLGLACLPCGGWRCSLSKRCLLTGLCALATLVNPYHVRLYGVVLEYATNPGAMHYVLELRAPTFRYLQEWVVVGLGGWALFSLARRQNWNVFDLSFLISAAIFALRSERDCWFLALAAVATLAGRPADLRHRLGWSGRLLVPVMLTCLIALLCWQRDISETNLRRNVAKVFPVEATVFLTKHQCHGPLFNDFNWGGYLIWSLPQLPVIVDGRTNLHGDERIIGLIKVWDGLPGWREDRNLACAGVVVANVETPLAYDLLYDPRFQMVHEDDVARVFVRIDSKLALKRCDERRVPSALPGWSDR